MTEPKPRRYGWRLAALMGENKVRTGTELHRLLAEKGYEITSSQRICSSWSVGQLNRL